MANLVNNDSRWLDALTHPPHFLSGHKPNDNVYRDFPDESLSVGRIVLPRFGPMLKEKSADLKLSPAHERALDRVAQDDFLFEDQLVNESSSPLSTPVASPSTRSVREDLRFVALRGITGETLVTKTRDLSVAFTRAGDKGPAVVFVHGVPTNRKQWWEVQSFVARFCRTLSFDLLGMGESSKPRNMPSEMWDWQLDTTYWHEVIRRAFPDPADATKHERVILIADDWGSGPNSHYAARFSDQLLGIVQQDPIAFDGYPVVEIQQIGRLQMLFDQLGDTPQARAMFRQATGGFEAMVGQIYNSMVHKPDNVYNQYSKRELLEPYIGTDYERLASDRVRISVEHFKHVVLQIEEALAGDDPMTKAVIKRFDLEQWYENALRNVRALEQLQDDSSMARVLRNTKQLIGELEESRIFQSDASSTTLLQDFHAIRVLANRASRLAPALLLPYDAERNPRGVEFHRITVPVQIQWGDKDNMMPPNQQYRFRFVLENAAWVRLVNIPHAGHFAATDKPEFVSEIILKFVEAIVGVGGDNGLADVFIGRTGLWKADEHALLSDARAIYGFRTDVVICSESSAAPETQEPVSSEDDAEFPAVI